MSAFRGAAARVEFDRKLHNLRLQAIDLLFEAQAESVDYVVVSRDEGLLLLLGAFNAAGERLHSAETQGWAQFRAVFSGAYVPMIRYADACPEEGFGYYTFRRPQAPRWLDRNPEHIREDLGAGIEAALEAVFGDTVTDGQLRAADAIVAATLGFEDTQRCLWDVHTAFGSKVFGALLLHNIESRNSLMGQSQTASWPQMLAQRGMSVADLGWPDEALKPHYRTNGS